MIIIRSIRIKITIIITIVVVIAAAIIGVTTAKD